MATLPQLIEDDIRRCDEILHAFIASTEATATLIIDKGGFLITHQGEAHDFDLTTIGALASGAFMANESSFDSIYQQGENFSMFVMNIDEHSLLVVIFKSHSGVGMVKYYAAGAVKRIARQLKIAKERAPGAGLDLSALNVAETGPFFRKKQP
jgi:predicted regulator of Ras-like GTPase activity (Roadblock/LC7/MglB family)